MFTQLLCFNYDYTHIIQHIHLKYVGTRGISSVNNAIAYKIIP